MNGGLLARVWLPGWLYHLLPWLCLVAGVSGLAYGLRAVALLPIVYALSVLSRRWCAAAVWLGSLAVLLAVPTITPTRTIVVSARPVTMEVIVVQSRAGNGPTKTTLTPRVSK